MMTTATSDITLQLPEEVASRVRATISELSMLPGVATQAIQISNDPDCAISDFCAVVERDAKLATDVLSMANSAMYSIGQPVLTLGQAVLRLGFAQCQNLILSTSMSSLMKRIRLEDEWVRESLYRHSFLTGLFALKINRALNVGFQGEEFTAGLLHDFGRTLMAVCFPDEFSSIDCMSFDEDSSDYLQKERQRLGVDHCQLGSWFAETVGLPGTLIASIRYHHTPDQAGGVRRLTSLIAVSDHLANHIHRFGKAEGYEVAANTALHTLEACGVRQATSRLGEIVLPLMDATVAECEDLCGF